MLELLSVKKIAFTVLDYPMSYVEFVGTILYLWSTVLIARRKILSWPVGIVSVLLYLVLFYQIRLYSDALEQVYYLGASIYGWVAWSRSPQAEGAVSGVGFSGWRSILVTAVITGIVSLGAGAFMSRAHLLLPVVFPEAASFAYLDALTTIMSFTAMWIMLRKRTESWVYWLIVDMIGIGLYYVKGVKFVALLYVVLTVIAVAGLNSWIKAGKETRDTVETQEV